MTAAQSGVSPKVYIVILNWNGWEDTVECLESVFGSSYPNFQVIACDNDSSDSSVERIKEWAEGTLRARPALHQSSGAPPASVEKPLRWIEHDPRSRAVRGANVPEAEARLILIRTGGNLGFAGGNNVGLRYALARGDLEYAWLLNNDTVVDQHALAELVHRMRLEPLAGICGSVLRDYGDPHRIQALGGATYYKWLGGGRMIGEGLCDANAIGREKVLKKLDYVAGASMLVCKSFLLDIGLMSEDYFLYFEEMDWAERARNRYSMTYSERSVVYHRHGGSTGKKAALSAAADYWNLRNRLVFTKRFYRYAVPGIYLSLLLALFNRLRKRQWGRSAMILRLLAGRETVLRG